MYKSRILIVGTRTWELTSIHLKYFVKAGANIVGFLESPTDTITSTTSGGSKNKPIHEVAEELNLPIIQSGKPKDPKVQEWIRNLEPEIIVVIGYQFFLPKDFLEIAPMGVVNFHTSLLPRHCGRHPGFWTIWYGDEFSGMTIHQMDDGLDTGKVLMRNLVPVENGDTVDTLYKRIWDADEVLVNEFLEVVERGSFEEPEDSYEYTYNYVPSEKDFQLDFRYDAQVNANRCSLKADTFFFMFEGQKVYPVRYRVIDEPVNSRNFKMDVCYRYHDSVVLVSPNKWFAVDEVKIDGETHTGADWATGVKVIGD